MLARELDHTKDLEPLDPEYVNERLSKPPFVSVPGVVNIRDLGSYPSSAHSGMVTKPRLLYRSGEISSITEQGKAQLKELGVSVVYDLRSDTEIAKYETPCPHIDGIDVVRTPVFSLEDYSPEMMAKCVDIPTGSLAFLSTFALNAMHIAGKDRTGVVAALLLKLAGVDDDTIAEDYALTRVGREPMRAMIMARLAKVPLFASNHEKALNMLTSRAEIMHAFLNLLDEKYGGVEEYLRRYVGLTDEDIAQIRQNLLIPTTVSDS
ncbi:hypothetical protein NM688_g5363 [Phlebia brevispora]|uniref:Uncharacterized protein n=1 Tax=Phlebia brevispora TaxID=194682 RepID=A0ACC1SWC5_9APHY|nr:hypothetical protein NM688_g5363 [Phlebia brevispora]